MATDDHDDNGVGNGQPRSREPELDDEQEMANEISFVESDEYTPEMSAQFHLSIAAYEQAPWTTQAQLLEEAGVDLPPPESLDDRQLTFKLSEVIEALARLRIFLSQTDHLSDRELYDSLWRDVLREAVKDMPLNESSAWYLDMLGSGSEEDIHLRLKYYADEDERQDWLASFPGDSIPDREEPPYDRDRHLPKSTDGDWGKADDEQMVN
ncbi:MAG: hypothetical protein M3R15_01200 [Acidobacteriota bacterium]|nr:hypothetical protein [Acidobacteriota bacterium]